MGQEEVPGHVEAGGDGRAEQEGGGQGQGGAGAASINLRKNLDGTETIGMTGSASDISAKASAVQQYSSITISLNLQTAYDQVHAAVALISLEEIEIPRLRV